MARTKQRVATEEGTGTVAYRLPLSEVNRLRAQAQRQGLRLSDYLRSITRRGLAAAESLEKSRGEVKK